MFLKLYFIVKLIKLAQSIQKFQNISDKLKRKSSPKQILLRRSTGVNILNPEISI